jgi:hypothetical protein
MASEPERKTCFVISPIGDVESDTRKRADKILKYVIAPAVAERGYEALRADQISEPGMITSQVIQHIVEDPLVVADLTDRNPNVFYELALRHALRKPLVQLIKKGEQLPFDVAGSRTIYVDHRDLDSVEEAKQQIGAQVDSLESNPSDIETPISVSLDLQMLRQSENPEQRTIGDVLTAMTELRSMVSNIDDRLNGPDAPLTKDFLIHALERGRRRAPRSQKMMMRLVDELSVLRAMMSDRGNLPPDELGERLQHLEFMAREVTEYQY